MDMQLQSEPFEFEIVSHTSRAAALEDGDLIDITYAAKEVGIQLPVAISREAWNLCVAMTPATRESRHTQARRLHDVVSMLLWAMRRSAPGRDIAFEVRCVTTNLRETCIPLRANVTYGDYAEPVMTLVLPEES